MTENIFVDTNPLIYILDEFVPFSDKTNSFFEAKILTGAEFYTSTITDAEFIVKPLIEHQFNKIDLYYRFLASCDFSKCVINENVASRSAHIRAKYKNIKLADALQLAAAIEYNCQIFLTNDKRLKQVSEIQVVLVDEL